MRGSNIHAPEKISMPFGYVLNIYISERLVVFS